RAERGRSAEIARRRRRAATPWNASRVVGSRRTRSRDLRREPGLQRADRVFTPAALVPFDTLRRSCDWTRWHELAADAPPYLGPEFFALIRPLARAGTPLVAEAWSSSRMLGALPLVLAGATLRAMRSDHSPGYDFCGNDAAIVAIWSCLRDDERWT